MNWRTRLSGGAWTSVVGRHRNLDVTVKLTKTFEDAHKGSVIRVMMIVTLRLRLTIV